MNLVRLLGPVQHRPPPHPRILQPHAFMHELARNFYATTALQGKAAMQVVEDTRAWGCNVMVEELLLPSMPIVREASRNRSIAACKLTVLAGCRHKLNMQRTCGC